MEHLTPTLAEMDDRTIAPDRRLVCSAPAASGAPVSTLATYSASSAPRTLSPGGIVSPSSASRPDPTPESRSYFEPFRRWFDPAFGRPSIPMETYLRLMFLKYLYCLGYESSCAEVSDSLTWLRFCRIPLGERAPHSSTLMKITTRCGSTTVAELNAHLVAVGVEAGVIDMGWLRADTTVVPAEIKYPTDSGLLTRGNTRIAVIVARSQAGGLAPAALLLVGEPHLTPTIKGCTRDGQRFDHAFRCRGGDARGVAVGPSRSQY